MVSGLVGWVLQPEQPYFSGDGGYQEQSTAYRAGGSGCEPSSLNDLPIRERQAKRDACEEAQEQHRQATNSLIEARRSANAADASTIAAYEQTGIAAWGVSLGFITMIAAIGAAIFAERAAAHTKRGADAAVDANNAARASLIPHSVIEIPPEHRSYVIKFRNMGQHLAFCKSLTCSFHPFLPEKPTWTFEGDFVFTIDWAVSSNQDVIVTTINAMPKDANHILGILEYTDSAGKERTSKFRYDRFNYGWHSAGDWAWNIID